jgi:recombination protein RecA
MARKAATKIEENTDEIFEYFKRELEAGESEKVETFISTGSTLLDYAISNRPDGGIPVGRITEIAGGEGSGKSLLAYHIMSNTQKKGGIAIYLDTERAYNQEFMERMGVDTKKNFIMPKSVPGSIEDVFEFIENVITLTRARIPNKDKFVTIVWDSVAATPGKDDIEVAHTHVARMGTEARAMSRSLRKITGALDAGHVTLVCINQLREKIGFGFGDPDTTPHGRSLPFYASVRIKLKSLKQIKEKDGRTVGVGTQAKVWKNKVGPNWRAVDFPIYYDWGVGDEISWLEFMKNLSFVKTSGAWSALSAEGEDHKFQSTHGWMKLATDKDIRKFILNEIENKMVIKFDRRPEDIEFEAESFLDVDQLKSDIKEK